MKTIGIIAEYNPFHNGHAYLIQRAKELTGADYVVIIMSGHFVQRGEPAIIDPYTRAEMALRSGADLVLQLPAYASCASAEYFAGAGVSILDSLGFIDYLAFGAECADIAFLKNAAYFLSDESLAYKKSLQKYLSQGMNFPSARSQALGELHKDDIAEVLAYPNNILAIEYLKAIRSAGSKLIPLPVQRNDQGYHSDNLNGHFLSASAIRNALFQGNDACNSGICPEDLSPLHNFIQTYGPVSVDDLTPYLAAKLLSDTTDLTDYVDINEDLANRIEHYRYDLISFSQFADLLTSRNMTQARIKRALLHLILQQKKKLLQEWRSHHYDGYVKLIGFNRNSASILRQIPDNIQPQVIQNYSQKPPALSDYALAVYHNDLYASSIYRQILQARSGQVQTYPKSVPMKILK